MEMFERRLLSQWETSGMGEDGCCCCCSFEGEAGLRRRNTLIQLLHKKEARLRRVGTCFAAFVLIVLALTLSVVFGLGGLHTLKCQSVKSAGNCPSELSSAVLTAPNNKPSGEYLQWEYQTGNAYCTGGFRYSNGSLVVPRNGTYNIFLQITYENDTCKNDVNLSYKVLMKSARYEDPIHLLSSVYTVSCSKKPWRKSLYSSISKHMLPNDKLFVTSSHPELIARSEQQVFFGAHLL